MNKMNKSLKKTRNEEEEEEELYLGKRQRGGETNDEIPFEVASNDLEPYQKPSI